MMCQQIFFLFLLSHNQSIKGDLKAGDIPVRWNEELRRNTAA
jgi:hypothetical protein